MIYFNQVRKTFDDGVVALNGVTTKINQGEFVVVLGPSGSGKTTMLRSVNGLVSLSKGSLEVNGLNLELNNLKEIRSQVGMIFQQFNLVGNLSVINNVISGCLASFPKWRSALYLFPKDLRLRALSVIDRVGLIDKAYQRTEEVTEGQQQRAGIARALMQQPKIILADEPIASLDPVIAHNILTLLKKICEEDNITVICSLHQVDFALNFSNRILGLCDGKVVLDQKTENLTPEYIQKIYKSHEKGMYFGVRKIAANDELVTWSAYN